MTRDAEQWLQIQDRDRKIIAEQRAVIEQQAKELAEFREWKHIILGTGTDQEAVIRMAATEYTKVAIQSWKEAHEAKQAEIEQQAKEIAKFRGALGRISRHAPIMGSTGDYRHGQLDVLESVKRIAEENL